MKVLIPTKVYELIEYSIQLQPELKDLTELQKSRLIIELINLWFLIYNRQRNDNEINRLDMYSNIHSDNFNKLVFKYNNKRIRYKKLIEILELVGLISINKKYSIQKSFTKSYRINTEIIGDDYTEVYIDTNKIFYNIKNKKYWLDKYPEYKKQINDTYDVKIDLGSYIKWCSYNIGMELRPIFIDGILTRRFLTKEKVYDYVYDILKINSNNIWFKISNEGRFYNSTTNLSYTILPFIKLKRRSVVEIDVANCQPLLLCKLISNEKYKKDVELGIFYNRMSEVLNIDKNQMKQKCFRWIFFTNKKLKSGEIYDAIQLLYPGLIDDINNLRDKISISKELQKIESNIFINNISNLDFKMVLRHDAVLVYKEDYDIIKSYVIDEFRKIGLKCKIKE